MYQLSDFRKGLKVLHDGEPYLVVDFQHVKPGKGNQFTRTKLRHLLTGTMVERTFRSGEKFEVPDVESRDMNYLYSDDSGFHFMDQTTYDQISMSEEDVGDTSNWLIENLQVSILFYNGRAVDVEVPNSVNLKVQQTDPGVKGNTVSGGTKPATLETGAVVLVPLHIREGDLLKIDTRNATYVERVNS